MESILLVAIIVIMILLFIRINLVNENLDVIINRLDVIDDSMTEIEQNLKSIRENIETLEKLCNSIRHDYSSIGNISNTNRTIIMENLNEEFRINSANIAECSNSILEHIDNTKVGVDKLVGAFDRLMSKIKVSISDKPVKTKTTKSNKNALNQPENCR